MFTARPADDAVARGNGRPAAGTSLDQVTPLRLAAAHVLVATAATTALERSDESPVAVRLAPLIVAPLAAATGILHARSPDERTATALRLLNSAVVLVGGALLITDLLRMRDGRHRRAGSLGFAAAGLLGLALERHAHEAELVQRDLHRRAAIVERFVPRRKARLDRIVVHV